MRLIAFETAAGEGVGALTPAGAIDFASIDIDLPREMPPLLAAFHGRWSDLQAVAKAGGPMAEGSFRLLPPVPRPGKLICVGLNYVDHAKESPYSDLPTNPVLFSRFTNSLVASGAPIVRPRNSEQLDWEGEIAVVIGRRARHERRDTALEAVAGYSLFQDASVRDYQFKSNQWLMGKTFDHTGGFGPCLTTADEVPDGARGLELRTLVNGQVMQRADTKDMIFDVATLIAYVTEGITLEPGDVIVSGTPAGVGFARKPPVYLRPGDVVEVVADPLGRLVNPIVAEAG